MKNRNKLLAILLSSAMVMSQLSVSIPVFAEEPEEIVEAVTEEDQELSEEAEETIEEEIADEEIAEEDFLLEDEQVGMLEEEEIILVNDEVEMDLEEEIDILSLLEESITQSDASVVKAYPVTLTVKNAAGDLTGMYAMDQGLVREMSDGTYQIRMHQKSENRGILALTEDKEEALNMKDQWVYADQWVYNISVKSISEPIVAVFSKDGSSFGNPMYITVADDVKTMSATATVTDASGKASGMYAVDNVVVTKQEDGTYLVKMHQAKENRNVIAVTDTTEKASTHAVDWQVADDYTFVIPVASLDAATPLAFSSTDRILAGNKFSNIMYLHFDTTAFGATEENDVTMEGAKILKADAKKALEITNNTGMFKAVSACLDEVAGQTILRFALSGTGYDTIMIGTYEDAKATTDVEPADSAKWIKSDVNASGKYEFAITLEEGTTYIPVAALSASYAAKGEYRWYPRQIELNKEAGTIVFGDYDHTSKLAVNCQDKILKNATAKLQTIGGPNSNGYKEILTLSEKNIAKVYLGTVEEAKKAENLIEAVDGTVVIPMRENAMGGSLTFDYLEKEMNLAVLTNDNIWTDVVLTVSKEQNSVNVKSATIVLPPVEKFTVQAASKKIAAGKKVTLKTQIAPTILQKEPVTWKVSNTKYASVDKKGVVTTKKAGAGKTVTVTATAIDGTKASIKLSIMKGAVSKITLSGNSSVKKGKSITLKAKVTTKGGTANKTLTWTSSDPKIATVDAKGKVTAKKKGKVTITAKATDGSGKKATKKITVK